MQQNLEDNEMYFFIIIFSFIFPHYLLYMYVFDVDTAAFVQFSVVVTDARIYFYYYSSCILTVYNLWSERKRGYK